MRVIGFGHRARQGKSTAAQAVLEACPLECQVRMYAFADALRREVRRACANAGGQFNLIQTYKECGLMPEWVHFEEPKPRSLLQWWGTDYRRKRDPDYWVRRLKTVLDLHRPDVALIPDVRFPNEADFIHGLHGVVVKVERTTAPDVLVLSHPSENALNGYTGWDFHIRAASVAECQEQAVRIYRELPL